MLVSHSKKFIYTKTVKTAGSSVKTYFEPYCFPDGAWEKSNPREEHISEYGIVGRGYRGAAAKGVYTYTNHMSAHKIKEKVGDDVWNDYFKFCVVRNPFDKLVSEFYWERNVRIDKTLPTKIKKILKKILRRPGVLDDIDHPDAVKAFRSWIARGGGNVDRDKYVMDGKICVDYVIFQENLQEGIKEVCSILDIPFKLEEIPSLKSGIREQKLSLSELYDQQTIERVKEKFNFELEHFGYSFPVK